MHNVREQESYSVCKLTSALQPARDKWQDQLAAVAIEWHQAVEAHLEVAVNKQQVPPADPNMTICFSCRVYKQAAYRLSSHHAVQALILTCTPNILLQLIGNQVPSPNALLFLRGRRR